MSGNDEDLIRVLLIEDQDAEALLISRMLAHTAYGQFVVEHASTLIAGTRMLATGHFDVCLLDLDLPDGVGIDSLHQVRSVDATLPIVVLTGSDDEQLGLTAIETGAQDYVSKHAVSGQFLSRVVRFSIARQKKVLGYAADANTDTLTGLPNRRQLDQCFGELMDSCQHMCVALLDLDHFKSINDEYGHLVGDQALRQLADVIREFAKDGIQSARFGGEEFAILLPDASIDDAFEAINQLLEQIADSPIDAGFPIRITASAGLSDVNPDDTLEDILHRSDIALYDAKRSGRNRTCVRNR